MADVPDVPDGVRGERRARGGAAGRLRRAAGGLAGRVRAGRRRHVAADRLRARMVVPKVMHCTVYDRLTSVVLTHTFRPDVNLSGTLFA